MKNKKEEVPVVSNDNINNEPLHRTDYKTTIENHKQAAKHLTEAAMHHLEAAKYYEEGNREKAAHSSMVAFGHHTIAGEFLTDAAKHHAQELKQTNYRQRKHQVYLYIHLAFTGKCKISRPYLCVMNIVAAVSWIIISAIFFKNNLAMEEPL